MSEYKGELAYITCSRCDRALGVEDAASISNRELMEAFQSEGWLFDLTARETKCPTHA